MTKLEKLVIATKNPAKLERYKNLFQNWANEIIGLQEIGIADKPEESGETAEENAQTKARFYSLRTNIPAFSEDESLFVDFLPESEQPGVHVRRINHRDEADDDKLLAYWEKIIATVPGEKRTGRWHIAYCLARPNDKLKIVSQDYPVLFFSPSSNIKIPGWPMSSLQGSIKFGKPSAELTPEENKKVDQDRDKKLLDAIKSLFNI